MTSAAPTPHTPPPPPPQGPAPRRRAPPPARSGRREPRRLPVVLAPDAPSLGLARQEDAELRGDRLRVVDQLPPGDADDAPAGDDELPVPGAVRFEGLARAVRREAVALDDESLLGPGGVELAVVASAVDRRARQVVGVEEGEEAALEDACRDGSSDVVVVVEDALEDRCPSASAVPRGQGIEGGRAREAPNLGLLERGFEVLFGQDRGEVEERAGRRGDRDAGLDGHFVLGQHDAVSLDSRPPPLARSDDLKP